MKATMMTYTEWTRAFDRMMMLMTILNIGDLYVRGEKEYECGWGEWGVRASAPLVWQFSDPYPTSPSRYYRGR